MYNYIVSFDILSKEKRLASLNHVNFKLLSKDQLSAKKMAKRMLNNSLVDYKNIQVSNYSNSEIFSKDYNGNFGESFIFDNGIIYFVENEGVELRILDKTATLTYFDEFNNKIESEFKNLDFINDDCKYCIDLFDSVQEAIKIKPNYE